MDEIKEAFLMRKWVVNMLCFIFCFIPSLAHAEWRNWDRWDKSLFESFVALDILDYGQTKYIYNHSGYHENILPSIINEDNLALWHFSYIIGSYLIADHLKPSYRKIFLGGLNLWEIGLVYNNKRIGIKITFHKRRKHEQRNL